MSICVGSVSVCVGLVSMCVVQVSMCVDPGPICVGHESITGLGQLSICVHDNLCWSSTNAVHPVSISVGLVSIHVGSV